MRFANKPRSILGLAVLAFVAASAVPGVASAGPVTAMPTSLTFPPTGTGAMAPEQMVTYTNNSMNGVTVSSIAVTGAANGDYMIDFGVFNPPFTITAGAAVTIGVIFKPTAGGVRNASLDATLGNGLGVVSVPLTGTGLGPKITVMPSPINAGGTKINVSTTTTVTIGNSGGGTVNVKSVAITGPDAASFNLGNVPQLPAALAPNQNFMAMLTFTPTRLGSFAATLNVGSDDPNNPMLAVPIKGLAGDPAIATDVGAVAFGNVRVGLSSMPQVVNVSNSGNSDLHITNVTAGGANPGDFPFDKSMLPMTLPVGASAPISVSFKPTAIGGRQAQIVISTDDPNTPNKAIGVLGNGTTSMLALCSNNLDFGTQKIYVASMNQNICIQNTGSDAANVIAIQPMGMQASWFRVSPQIVLPLKVAAGQMVNIPVAAVPLGLGPGAATVGIMTDDPKMPSFMVPVKVNGVGSSIKVDPPFADFGVVGVLGMKTVTVKVTNQGTDTLNLSSYQETDMNMVFPVNNMPMTPLMLPPGMSTSFDVLCKPQVEGMFQGEIDLITDDPMAKNVHIPLDCVGKQAVLSVNPTMLSFNMVLVDPKNPGANTSAPQNLMISNMGGAPLNITSVTITGMQAQDFRIDPADMGPFMLAAMQTRTIPVVYAPVAAGMHGATLVVTPDGLNPAMVPLKGAAVSPALQVAAGMMALDFGDVDVGMTSDPQTVHIKNSGGTALTLTIASSDPTAFPVDLTTTMTQLNLGPNATTQFNVTFAPQAAGMKTAMISITQSGIKGPLQTISVKGNGITPVPVTRGGTSCSMARGRGAGGSSALLLLSLAVPLALLRRRRRAHG